MSDKKEKLLKYILLPVLLVAFSLLKVTKGVNLADTTYSLGNYRFFTQSEGPWFLLTFISNVTGFILMHLPFGKYMLGMNIYSSLIVGALAIMGYRFFITKMPYWMAFLSQVAALGMCWAPKSILYHYLTYFLLTFGAIMLFRGLAGSRDKCLYVAGIILGINALVRFPNNGLEVLLIIPAIYYGIITHTNGKDICKWIIKCVAGYLIGFVLSLLLMSFKYGPYAFINLVNGVSGISNSASDYTLGSMLLSILDAYAHGLRWALYLIVCALMGVPFFLLFEGKFTKLRKYIYCLCIVFLFFVLYKWGMFNFKYFQKEAALQWGVVFLILSIAVDIWVLITKQINNDWKLIGAMSLIIIIITPLGSNNYVWPLLNNLFIVAPVTFWMMYRFICWGRKYLDYSNKVPLFGIKAMAAATLIMFFIQAFGIGCFYVFAEGEDGIKVDTKVTNSSVLYGMKTTKDKADALSGLAEYINAKNDVVIDKELILYGNLPGLSYILNMPSALNTTWSDLDSNPVENMDEAIKNINGTDVNKRPMVILSRELNDVPDNSIKLNLINNYIENNNYIMTYENNMFVVYE